MQSWVAMQFKVDKSNWKKVRLGDVATEYSKRCNNPSESGFERFIGSSNINQWDFRINSWESTDSVTSAMKLFEPNDYLLVRRSLYASDFRERAPRANFAGVCSGDILTIRENPKMIADGFLIGILNSPALWKYVVANASGSITRRIKWRDLANYEFLLPPKEQQAELAELLWAMDEVIEKDFAVLEKLRVSKESMERVFLKDDSYETDSIMNIASVQRGRFSHRPRNAPEFYGGNIPFIQTGEVVESDKYISNFTQTLNEKGLSISKMFPMGTIVMTIAANIGYVGILSFDSAFTDSLVGIQADENKVTQDYLYYYLNSKRLAVESLATQSAQKNLSIEGFSSFQVAYPSDKKKQNQITASLDSIREIIDTTLEKISASKALQKSLINEVF
ncbi:restriction endonuclease subunit S [Arsukibacterium indicum]|uniref:Restriction endonuclease subunit S n=1 Tax=Arsukibacterium indicum TaxID=2848612 RepID=A0ABS6MN49_9GAMM|nr:restriction endonuclease subunit S [Arsukibacterium indicum]MBV2130216.1 restriction endonuclease subunit S [Arsukibacterium indicum]